MSTAVTPNSELIRLSLNLWHPNCWTTRVTDRTDAGLLGHGIYTEDDGIAKGRFTAYSDTNSEIDKIINQIKNSELTNSVIEVKQTPAQYSQVGNTVRELFVEFDSTNSIDDAFVNRGFVYDGPTRIANGREKWSLVAHHNREEIQRLLDEIRTQMDAEITITRISSTEQLHDQATPSTEQLSARQREVFELARTEGYYEWPREISACELADKLGITKTTLLEHLRKAESKLLTSVP